MKFTWNNEIMGRKREEQKYEVRSKGVHRKREMADSLETHAERNKGSENLEKKI